MWLSHEEKYITSFEVPAIHEFPDKEKKKKEGSVNTEKALHMEHKLVMTH